jgi:hypothetical protein
MKLGHLKISLLITILPLCVTFSQGRNDSYPIKQFNSRHLSSSPLHAKELKSIDFINKYIIPHPININHNSPELLDSIVNICQPPFNNQKYIFYYDNSGRINYYLLQYWYNGQWDNSDRNTYYYDSLGNLACELFEWNGGQWFPNYKTTYTYDENRNNISQLFEVYNDSQWVNWSLYIFNYDNGGNLVKNSAMSWNIQEWVNNYQATYFIKNGVRDSIFFESWVEGQWVNLLSFKPQYDDQGHLITVLWKSWSDSQWVNYLRGSWNNDLYGNIVSGLIEDWDGNQWINDSRFFYNNNSKNYFTHGLNEIWQNGTWIPGDWEFYFSRLDIFTLGFIGTELSVYYKITSAVEKTSTLEEYNLSQNYPNPFNPATTIRFTIPADGQVQLQVYDILGREIATLVNEYRRKGNYEVKFDAGKLSSGIYIYRIKCGSFTNSKMMVLQK